MQEDRSGRDRIVQTCAPGSAFGELALLYASPRAATVIASSDCRLWMMERKVYKAIRTNFDKMQLEEKWALMDKVTALQSLSKDEKMRLVEALELVRAIYVASSTVSTSPEVD
jgi:CRP-like cAMP-binding protein